VPSEVRALRRLLAEQFPDATPLAERDALRLARPVSTGIGALDAALLGGGLPRGKLTAWTPAGGAAAVLRAACRATLAAGERAAWVDAAHAVPLAWAEGVADARDGVPRAAPHGAPHDAPHDAPHGARADARDTPLRDARGILRWRDDAPLVVRAGERTSALRGAELLLRSGAFALVVLETAPGEEPRGTETVRVARAAREGGAACVVLTESASMAALRVSSRLDTRGVRWRHGPFGDPAEPVDVHVDVWARASGWNAHVRLALPVTPYDLRCALAPGPDRRGAARDQRAARAWERLLDECDPPEERGPPRRHGGTE
jgi:RecA/RadA recombinase